MISDPVWYLLNSFITFFDKTNFAFFVKQINVCVKELNIHSTWCFVRMCTDVGILSWNNELHFPDAPESIRDLVCCLNLGFSFINLFVQNMNETIVISKSRNINRHSVHTSLIGLLESSATSGVPRYSFVFPTCGSGQVEINSDALSKFYGSRVNLNSLVTLT